MGNIRSKSKKKQPPSTGRPVQPGFTGLPGGTQPVNMPSSSTIGGPLEPPGNSVSFSHPSQMTQPQHSVPMGIPGQLAHAASAQGMSGPNPTPQTPWPDSRRKRVIAMFDFEGNLPEDLSFQKGDEMVILDPDEAGPWIYAQNVRTGRQGYIPYNFVTERTNTDATQPWFFDCDRREAERRMLPPGLEKGTFMIRRAADGNLALTVKDVDRDRGGTVKHYKIKRQEDAIEGSIRYYISPKKPFSSLEELVQHYSAHDDGLCCRLAAVCPKSRPRPPFRELQVPRINIELKKRLGSGMFGEVWLGKWRALDVAVKTMKAQAMDHNSFLEEAKTMHKLQHERLVTLYCICTDGPLWIVSEYMNKGSLLDFLRQDNGSVVTFQLLIDFLAQVSEGMAYLEQKEFVHRDLRAANVLVNDQYQVKIADFGLTRSNDYDFTVDAKFPVRWTAPEAAHKRLFTVKSDVWSFGILVYEVVTYGQLPYSGMSGAEALKHVDRGYRLPRPENHECPESLYTIQLACWNRDPQARPSFESLYDQLTTFFQNGPSNYG